MENHEAFKNNDDYQILSPDDFQEFWNSTDDHDELEFQSDFPSNSCLMSTTSQNSHSQISQQHLARTVSTETVPPELLKTNNQWNSTPSNFVFPVNNSDSSPVAASASDHGRVTPSSYKAKSDRSAPTSFVITFNNSDSSPAPNSVISAPGSHKQGPVRTPFQAQEHIAAERERREMLNRRFIALSAAVPNLKKVDKATILDEAVKYLNYLKERVKTLEDQAATESSIVVKNSKLHYSDDNDLPSPSTEEIKEQPLPEIQARVMDRDVCIRIHFENDKGISPSTLFEEIGKLHLSIIQSNILPFGNSTLHLTVIAKMEDGFSMTLEDLTEYLMQALHSHRNSICMEI